jgi:4-amino-4-deoxy-L-arabinose transferase-like glycosyltransferase
VISSSVCTILVFQIGTLLRDRRTGWLAALLYTCSPYGSIATGVFILPDSPEMAFWFASLYVLIQLAKSEGKHSAQMRNWLWFGVLSGFCILSKVHGIFVWLGAFGYACFFDRKWLKEPGIYYAMTITMVMASPILFWNIQNQFVSIRFHAHRAAINSNMDTWLFVKQFWELVWINNPVIFFLTLKSLVRIVSGKFRAGRKETAIILFCSLPLALSLLILSFFRETYPHWPGPAYSTLLFLPAIDLGESTRNRIRWIPGILKLAMLLLILFSSSLILITRYYPGTMSPVQDGIEVGNGDAGLDMIGWTELGIRFDSLFRSDVRNHHMTASAPLVVTKWYPAGHEDFYIGHFTGQETFGIGGIDSLHQYYWTNQFKKPLVEGGNGYYIIPSNQFESKTFDRLTEHFSRFELALTLPQYRSGVICKQVYVFRLMGYKQHI